MMISISTQCHLTSQRHREHREGENIFHLSLASTELTTRIFRTDKLMDLIKTCILIYLSKSETNIYNSRDVSFVSFEEK